jgi:hypothetical protein
MNRPDAIARHRTALLVIVSSIAALIGGRVLRQAQEEGGVIARGLRNAALALLRPAEAAARRLIVLAAEVLTVAPRPAPVFAGPPGRGREGPARPPAFRLADPPKRFAWKPVPPPPPAGAPRIRTFWAAPFATPPQAPAPQEPPRRPQPTATVDASRLALRLAALERALGDLPRQARRLARWRLRRAAAMGPRPRSPLRLGHPPGHRHRRIHDVDDVLRECHALAIEALARDNRHPDSS